ncbi:hypothetical protein PHLCEN_2v4438 [Hermanssonia centrifuga]|uniref:Aminoglycoside phosphotransferase domain-containing protein n=1 Tax=Hermanssonia centrifuga TaxID=98765 RepID=A0A2R6PNL4_9APHY|nr:hypothetical protein PHLCEN_2v4438 [Hermanssonia centrifuga]
MEEPAVTPTKTDVLMKTRPTQQRKRQARAPTMPIEVELAQGEVLYDYALRTIVKLKSGRVVKCGCIRPEEAKIMRYIQSHTKIPVPGNVEYLIEGSKTYLFMDYVDGEPLYKAWPTLQEHERISILDDLKGYMDQLRALRQDDLDDDAPRYIGSLDRGPCADRRVIGYYECGPFETERTFNDHIIATLRETMSAGHRRFLREFLKDDHQIYFTHGDLHPGNILVKNGHVVALLDWEMAGWYPEYWEWCKSLFDEKWLGLKGWEDCRRAWLRPYEYEYLMDRMLLSQSPSHW